jgi:4-aminobutyrate aminotransferase/(S)-3-amino-2-methylpropionate transaminase
MKLANMYIPKAVYTSTPVFASEGQGAILKDVDGNMFIDFSTGISSVNMGHQHPRIIEAMHEQLNKHLHLCFHVTPYESYVRLAEKLATMAPGSFDKRVVLVNSGAEAVENAIKIVRRSSGKPNIIVFENAFHGRTRLAMSLTGSVHPYKYGFGLSDQAIHRTPYAYCYRCSFGLEYKSCNMRCVEFIKDTLATHISPDSVAAILLEPIIGEGGFIFPPKEFVKSLRMICDENGIVLISDEIQTGMGRTGKIFAIDHYDVVPDVLTMAKSLGGGLPLGAAICKAELCDSVQIGGLGGTFGGNPLSCVASLHALEVIQNSLGVSEKRGKTLIARLKEIQKDNEIIGDVRGLGLMAAVELVKNRKTKEPATEARNQILKECIEGGLIILGAGSWKNVIRFLPPVNIEEPLLNKGLDIFEDALKRVASSK